MQDRIVIITDSGRGVGQATAKAFAQHGAQVVLFSRTQAQLETTAAIRQQGGKDPLIVVGDVSSEKDVLHLFQHVIERYRRLDILVNSAAVVAVRPFLEMETTTWDQIININLRGTFLCCREAFKIMASQKQGVIINISSLSGVKGVEKFPGLSA